MNEITQCIFLLKMNERSCETAGKTRENLTLSTYKGFPDPTVATSNSSALIIGYIDSLVTIS